MKHWLLDAQPPERLVQLRARGDASWRWSQPGIGFDAEGRPQFRLDHGTLAAGPGIGDMLAQLAVAIGVFAQWASEGTPPESRISFADASANLQAAARSGLAARLRWFDGRDASASDAALDVLRDARAGLAALGVDAAVAAAWLDRMGRRIATHRTAARWQLARLQLRGGDLAAVTRDYAERAASNEPVHGWS